MARLPIYAWIRNNICGGGDVRGARIAELEASSSRTSGEIATPMSLMVANTHAFATYHDGAPMKNGSPYEALNTNRRPSPESAKKLWTGGNSVFCGRVVVAFSPMTAQPVLWALEGSFITRVRWRAARHSAILTAFSDGILKRSAMS